MRTLFWVLILCFAMNPDVSAQSSSTQFNLMPMPARMNVGTDQLPITEGFSVAIGGYKEPRLSHAVERFLRGVALRTGLPVRIQVAEVGKATLEIHAERASKHVQDMNEDESYVLDVNGTNAKLSAENPLGILHGLQTFLQLIEITPTGFVARAVHIEDAPRFPWRGLMIDVSRHFIAMDTLKRNVDGMTAAKMNVLHLHLSDNQGFRMESRALPKLVTTGSDGMYYTQEEMRDLIAYARDRGVRVVPEFDMPGHSTSWFVGYPGLSSGPGSYQIERRWGIFDPAMDPTREETYKFLDKFIGEMAEFFPDSYFHIGGDEVNGKQWDQNPKIQQFMRTHNIKNDEALQQYFTLQVEKIVSKHHKIMVGWDEILEPGMPQDIVIQSWRGQDSLAQAAQQGYRGLLSSGYYLDAMTPASQYYAVDPMSNADARLTPEQKKILGGEACMWSEFISDENIESRIWPRAAAIAERLWSPQQIQDVDSMYRRLGAMSLELEQIGLRHRANPELMLARMAGTESASPLRTLARIAEPAGLSVREKEAESAGGIQTSETALNRMVDAVAPESAVARQFTRAVEQFIASNFKDADAEAYIREQLTMWRDNNERLQPLLQSSYLLKEVSPVSQDLSALGAAGLQALDYIDKAQTAPDSWHSQQLAAVQAAVAPTADLTVAVAPTVQKLIDASAVPKR